MKNFLSVLLLLTILVSSMSLVGCSSKSKNKRENKSTPCTHNSTTKATCITPETCNECGEILEEALGHNYSEATCTSEKYCKRCHERFDAALGHTTDIGKCERCNQYIYTRDEQPIYDSVVKATTLFFPKMYGISTIDELGDIDVYEAHYWCYETESGKVLLKVHIEFWIHNKYGEADFPNFEYWICDSKIYDLNGFNSENDFNKFHAENPEDFKEAYYRNFNNLTELKERISTILPE